MKAGHFRYRRGHIRILDAAAVEQAAYECYATVNGHYKRM